MRPLLRRLGLVTRGELRAAEEKLRGVRQRLDKATERLAEATAASERLQQARREDGQRYKARLAEREADDTRRTAQGKEAAARASKRIAALEHELRRRDAQLEADTRQQATLEEHVASAARNLEVARASLVAIEVKLDILEGAANVLDARMRKGPTAS